MVSEPVVEDNENETGTTSVKPKGPPQEDFPWPHFASLAMHNLIAHWELQPVKVAQEEASIKTPPKVNISFIYILLLFKIDALELNGYP